MQNQYYSLTEAGLVVHKHPQISFGHAILLHGGSFGVLSNILEHGQMAGREVSQTSNVAVMDYALKIQH